MKNSDFNDKEEKLPFYSVISCSNWTTSDGSRLSIKKNPIKKFEEKILIFLADIIDIHHFPLIYYHRKTYKDSLFRLFMMFQDFNTSNIDLPGILTHLITIYSKSSSKG